VKALDYFNGAFAVARWPGRFLLSGFASALFAGSLLGQQPEAGKPLRSPEFESCKTNLNRIFDAIQEYQRDRGAWPELISDLHPEYIADLNRFLCPENLRRGEHPQEVNSLRRTAFQDPVPTDYTYEFNRKPYPLWAGFASTERDYKLRQMDIVGSNVPIVRCMHHDPKLFLSVGGRIFEQSGSDWESLFANEQARMEQWRPQVVFRDFAPTPGRLTNGITQRDPATEPNLIDLRRHYTSGLGTPWLYRGGGISLSNMPQGRVQLTTIPVPFDVRGVIQLGSSNMLSPFPERATEIAVGQKSHFLHFLQGAVQGEPFGRRKSADARGTAIGHYEVHYTDGRSLSIPIRYGQDVLACQEAREAFATYEAKVAWQGTNKTIRIRLYHQQWQNPRPNTQIASLDFISNMKEAAPFLIAVTLEP